MKFSSAITNKILMVPIVMVCSNVQPSAITYFNKRYKIRSTCNIINMPKFLNLIKQSFCPILITVINYSKPCRVRVLM